MATKSMKYAGKLKERRKRGKASGRHARKWNNKYYVLAYIFAKELKNDKALSDRLGINYHTFRDWIRARPTLRWAVTEARRPNMDSGTVSTVIDYISGRLPKKLQKVYRQICSKQQKRSTAEELFTKLKNLDDREMKQLFLHAYVASNFSRSRACQKLGISYARLQGWCRDKVFQELMDTIQEEMKDFFESSLIRLVKEGDAQATIFANKSKNKDRGYGDKLDVQVSGTIHHEHLVQVDMTKLSLRARKEVFDLMESQEKGKQKQEELQMRNAGQTLMIPGRK